MKWVWRILGGIVALLVVCVAGLWLAGLRPGHGHHSASVEINRPAAQVWRYLTADDLVKKWISGLEVIRHDSPASKVRARRCTWRKVIRGNASRWK